jgi:DNA-binding LytR/AlgR family response regulator
MDINMRFMDGMTAAEKIRTVDEAVVIIFITNSPQYVMKGYAVDALDYVLKPVNYFAFSQRIDRALGRMAQRKKQYISVAVKGGVQKLALSDLRCIEVFDHDLVYHTSNGDIASRGSLGEAEQQLDKTNSSAAARAIWLIWNTLTACRTMKFFWMIFVFPSAAAEKRN